MKQFKLTDLMEDKKELTVTLKLTGYDIGNFIDFLEDVSKEAAGGAGVEVKAESGSGEFAKAYIDGDGSDRIEVQRHEA